MKYLYHSQHDLDLLAQHLQSGASIESTLRVFVSVSEKSKEIRTLKELQEAVRTAIPGGLISVVGKSLYNIRVRRVMVDSRSLLAAALHMAKEDMKIIVPQGCVLNLVDNLIQVPYFLEDFHSGDLQTQNKITILLTNHTDFKI